MFVTELFPCGAEGQPPQMPEPATHFEDVKLFTADQMYCYGYEAYRRGHADCAGGVNPMPPFQSQ